ncbi:hypothetical protein V2W45_1469557 [Cenococcum geophilum]
MAYSIALCGGVYKREPIAYKIRLLKLKDNGGLSLAKFVSDNIPPYAILSHIWGEDYKEVTFKDLMDSLGKSKAGYTKIRFCMTQAAKDGLQYPRVGTCCIDKSSSAELSEAINSMFRWYHDATKCYVYLSDVSIGSSVGNELRWFTRGWTLQELVAPTWVEFFSVEGDRLGDKDSMVQEIHEVTGIRIRALQGSPLSRFSAARRETKREEDAACSLLGIFDIDIPPIYGEGRRKEFIRLRKGIEGSLRDK